MSTLGLSRITDCVYTVQHGARGWFYVRVEPSGDIISEAWFPKRHEAEKHAIEEREREEAEHGQFGVGS